MKRLKSMKNENINIEERFLQERFGRENPFRTPEGYISSLVERVMTALPDKEETAEVKAVTIPLWKRLRPLAVAASVCLLIGGVGTVAYKTFTTNESNQAVVAKKAPTDNGNVARVSNIDQAVTDYQIDEEDLFAMMYDE